jgi:hypothetical protein
MDSAGPRTAGWFGRRQLIPDIGNGVRVEVLRSLFVGTELGKREFSGREFFLHVF